MTDLTPVDRETWRSERRQLAPRFRVEMPILPYQGRTAGGHECIEVTRKSSLNLRQAVEMFGNAVKRECGYDFPLARATDLGDQRVWLLSAPRIGAISFVAAGAVSFEPVDRSWELRWMYVHPFERGHQVIDFYWPRFASLYGEFTVQKPITPAAQAVLDRVGWTWRGPKAATSTPSDA